MKKNKTNGMDMLTYIAGGVAGLLGMGWAVRKGIDVVHDSIGKVLMTDLYDENMLELFSAATRVGPQIIMEANLKAEEGTSIDRPLGPPKKFPSLENIMFSIGQMHHMPTPFEQPVDCSVVIGKKAKKPFRIGLPIMVAPMAYGVALSKEAKIALAQGATIANTAFCTGEGPYLEEERKYAKTYIYQYHRGCWDKTPEILANCEAIEIQLGQGAIGGVGHRLESKKMDEKLRKAFKLDKGQDAVAHSRQPEVTTPKDMEKLVAKLKRLSGGVPIGVKMGAGKYLEADLDWVCSSGVDYVVLEGAEAGSKGSAPILQDDFGVPTVFAISRGAEWLYKNNFNKEVSLIACGKIRTPGEVLKAIALGADACYMGAILLFAMTHTQVLNALPFEPPTQVVWYDGKHADKFDSKLGAKYLSNFLKASRIEIDEGLRGLGKIEISEVNRSDIFAIDETIAKGCKIPMAYEPFNYKDKEKINIVNGKHFQGNPCEKPKRGDKS